MVAELEAARDALSRQGEATGACASRRRSPSATRIWRRCWRSWRCAIRGCEISASYSDRLVDLVGEGFDAAVRMGVLTDSSLIARRIAPMRGDLVASPDYLARARDAAHARRPRGPRRDPARRQGLAFRDGGAGRHVPAPRPVHRRQRAGRSRRGVVAGLGIAVLPTFLAGPALARGELVPLLHDYPIPEAGLYVVRPPPAEPMTEKIRALTDILLEQFGDSHWDACPRPD